MDHDTAPPVTSRRTLIAGTAAAGLVGAAVLLSEPTQAAPLRPTAADTATLALAMAFELTAQDLYRLAAANVPDSAHDLMMTFAKNHEAYAEGIAALIGVAARVRNEEVYAALEAAFSASSLTDVALAAYELESQAIATHTAEIPGYENIDAVELTVSIVVVEARHAAVLADVAGRGDDLDALLVNDASPLDLAGGAA